LNNRIWRAGENLKKYFHVSVLEPLNAEEQIHFLRGVLMTQWPILDDS